MGAHLLYHFQYRNFRNLTVDEVINIYEEKNWDKFFLADVLITFLLLDKILNATFIFNFIEDINGDLFLQGAGITGSLFWFTVLMNCHKLICILFKRGCNIESVGSCDICNFIDATPLIVECQYRYTFTVKYLVTHGAKLNTVNYKDGLTPLMILCDHNYISYFFNILCWL